MNYGWRNLSIPISVCRKNVTEPDEMIIFHDPHCVEYSAPGHPERPARIARTVSLLKDRHPTWEWREPQPPKERNLLRAHSREHLHHVANPTGDFDTDTP